MDEKICEKHNMVMVFKEKIYKRKNGRYYKERRWVCSKCNADHQYKWWVNNKEVQQRKVKQNKQNKQKITFDFRLNNACIICRREESFVFRV